MHLLPDPTTSAPRPRARLRALLDAAVASGRPLVAPGCYDALGARLVEQAGFEAAYMTGFGTAASMLGRPDVGLIHQGEMCDAVRRVAAATSLPLIADADTGYGNALNVIRTVQLWEQAGAAALHLEDQVTPKRCGHMRDKQVIDAAEAAAKIRAAAAARTDPDLVLIARTDARAVLGVDDAVERAERFAEAGADLLFVEALQGEAEIEAVCERLRGHRLVFNWVDGGRTPQLTYERIAELGFALVICPVTLLLAVTAAARAALDVLHADGTPWRLGAQLAAQRPASVGFAEFNELIGLGEIDALGTRFA